MCGFVLSLSIFQPTHQEGLALHEMSRRRIPRATIPEWELRSSRHPPLHQNQQETRDSDLQYATEEMVCFHSTERKRSVWRGILCFIVSVNHMRPWKTLAFMKVCLIDERY
jgi:hypothetical protein